MVSKPDATRAYFDKIPGQWDALYLHENRTKYFFNKIFRRALFERHRLTFEQCGDITGATVLDIGCGTGRFSIEFAARGASRVVGIDFSAAMIEYAHTLAQDHNVGDRCYFVRDDFLSHEFWQRFRIVVAMG
ncbi:MAG TPA: class I SAM-dependent methyltransferase, partial [Desulfomonilaceae bacterium]|nr:class I SAM-dependent methyltransferase [Desulfomonilaceae bacterium]